MGKYAIVNDDYLQHHGIKDQRWYVRRFQPYPKGYKGKGKEVGAAKKVKQRKPSYREKRMMRKEKKKQEKEFKNLRKEQQQQYDSVRNDPKAEQMVKTAAQRQKEKAIASGNVNKILKYKDQMSNKELEDAIKRTKLLNELKDLSVSEKKSAKNTFDKAVNKNPNKDDKKDKDLLSKMRKVNDYASTGITMYNNANKIIKIAKTIKKNKKNKS